MPTQSIPVFYVRHGESVWNAAQGEARKEGRSEAVVRALGDELRFTDAPLTPKGVAQALGVRERLFSDGAAGSLAALLRCAMAREGCPFPQLFVSNLRRAVDTGLLAFRPLIEARADDDHVVALPSLQETCWYADCVPLPRAAGGSLEPPPLGATGDVPLPSSPPTTHGEQLVRYVLELQSSALDKSLDASTPAADSQYLRDAYARRLTLAPHARFYDDRRRMADGLSQGHTPCTAHTVHLPLGALLRLCAVCVFHRPVARRGRAAAVAGARTLDATARRANRRHPLRHLARAG